MRTTKPSRKGEQLIPLSR